MAKYNVEIAETALWTLEDIESFNAERIGAQQAASLADKLLTDSVRTLEVDPTRYRFSARLANKGLNLRERITPDGKYIVIYDFDGENVWILLFLSTRQDLEGLLHRYVITME